MRPLTEEEQTAVFSKLANYIVGAGRHDKEFRLDWLISGLWVKVGQEYRSPCGPRRRTTLLQATQRSGLLCFRVGYETFH